VLERILVFCLASNTDWQAASITHATARQMMVRGLIERDQAASRFLLTEQGRPCWRRCSRKAGDDGTESLLSGVDRKTFARFEVFGF
jgi:hypothetical protein